MPSERTRLYLDELEDRFEKRAEFYESLEKQLKEKKNDYKTRTKKQKRSNGM
jgi:dTDP-4-amino-4,6-dideoxygalactose transaminase